MSLRLVALVSAALTACAQAVTLTVGTTGGNASSPNLYGIMFEDINNSGDGGIHGQLLQNNGFQGVTPGLKAWSAVGSAQVAQDTSSPLSSQLPSTLSISVAQGASGPVGVANSGYLGVPVNQDTYATSFWYKGSYTGDLIVSLVGNNGTGTTFASSNVSVTSGTTFQEYNATLDASQSPDGNNVWQVTFDPSATADITINLGLPQLFPTTYHGRTNGLRNDVASFVGDIKPSFLRFPGGNNIEGSSPADRWQWNLTIGPLQNRPGRQGDWGYPNTDALGLMEYLDWCSDMGMAPVLAIWSGLTLGGGVVSGDALQPYIDDALNELEFLLGDATTTWGSLRAQYGQSDPYDITMLEIGNEDNLSGGCDTYASRFQAFHDAIASAYPNLQIIASTSDATCLPDPLPTNAWTDIHHYETPDAFVASFNEFDNYPRTTGYGIFVGEYASTTGNDGSQTYWTFMQASCAEAVYMIGMERNSDLVKMASFAPLLEHFNMVEWSPDLLGFNSTPGSLTGSTSYYVQQIFSTQRGATILPVTSDSAFGPVYWVASQSGDGSAFYVKLANYGAEAQNVTITIPDATGLSGTATLQLVSGAQNASNFPNNVTVTATSSSVTGSAAGGYAVSLPAWGVAVLAVSSG